MFDNSLFEPVDSSLSSSNQDHFFKELYYFSMDKGKKSLYLSASDLSFNQLSNKVSFLNPKGKIFNNQELPVDYVAKSGFYKKRTEFLHLNKDVELSDLDSFLSADSIDYYIARDKLNAKGDVRSRNRNRKTGDRIFINGNEVKSNPKMKKSKYIGNVHGVIKRKRIYEESVNFKSDFLDFDLLENHIELDGNVEILKDSMTAKSLKGEILLENYNKKLKYYALYDDVRVIESLTLETGEVIERKAFSEKLEGILSENKIILTGYPKVFQSGDVIKGNRVVLRENNEVIEVDDANTNFQIK